MRYPSIPAVTLFLTTTLMPVAVFGQQSPAAEASAAAGPEVQLEETVVRGQADTTPYKAEEAMTGTKTPTPIAETPISVQVITRQLFEDQGALRLQDVYENVSGVVQSGNTLNARTEVAPFIRGFESFELLRNGLRATNSGTIDLVNIERVEVLKGPASILYGALDPGGVLNFVTKKPLDVPYYELEQTIGSYDLYRTSFDATGPLNDDKTLLYRFNGAYMDSNSFRDEIDLERISVAPSLTWRIASQTEITFDFSYTNEQVPYDTGIPFDLQGNPAVSKHTFMGNEDLDGRDIHDAFASYQLTHAFDDVFSLRHQFQWHRAHAYNEAIRPRGVRDADSDGIIEYRRRYQNENRRDDEYQTVTDLLAQFDTGEIHHDFLVGVELILQDTDFFRQRQNLPDLELEPGFDPEAPAPTGIAEQTDFSDTQRVGVYVQDQLSMLEDKRLHVLLGGRFDYFEQQNESDGVDAPNVNEGAFTGRAGVLYELTDWVSPYVSVTQSFEPQFAGTLDASGNLLDPEEGLQYEAGLKFQLFEERLLATVAFYDLTKENVAVFDQELFDNTGQEAFFPGVEERSRGVELDVTGAITPELSVLVAYAYTDTEVIENAGDPGQEGDRFGNVPLHSTRVWLAYNFAQNTAMEGLGFGAGLRYVSEFTAEFDQSLLLDEYITFDAGVWYRKPLRTGQVLKLQLNVENIFNEDYFVRASDRGIVHPGEPLLVFGSIGIEF